MTQCNSLHATTPPTTGALPAWTCLGQDGMASVGGVCRPGSHVNRESERCLRRMRLLPEYVRHHRTSMKRKHFSQSFCCRANATTRTQQLFPKFLRRAGETEASSAPYAGLAPAIVTSKARELSIQDKDSSTMLVPQN